MSAIVLNKPLILDPVTVKKPWGEEIWFSGIEERGVSSCNGIPINFLFEIFGEFLGCSKPPILLKILAPSPEPNLGDLYFELHEKKTEVYVVTDINRESWPNGKGKIRLGFNRDEILRHGSPERFIEKYLSAVEKYQRCRNYIDSKLDEKKMSLGLPEDEIIELKLYKTLTAELDRSLVEEEKMLREEMYRFTKLHEIKIGDAVKVNPYIPHSLQHGIKVIEFQTPHYERYILSFGQKVITQDHWDTKAALMKAKVSETKIEHPKKMNAFQDMVADFEEFNVVRTVLPSGKKLEIAEEGYCLIMGIFGESRLGSERVKNEKAFFIPPTDSLVITNESDSESCFLIASENQLGSK
ncbi:hypothetical protein OA067_00745 [Gammaproteobacteria bacterium]|nr:hypothetical protein [Gammaproteobacteria bacterium]